MKRLLLCLGVVFLIGVTVALSQPKPEPPEFNFKMEDRNPVSHLRLNNSPEEFQFALVSDRSGGHRARIFSQAVEQLNLLQPEFVVSVGDLIEGGTENLDRLTAEWREFQGYISRLQMPFFYVPGNHDISNMFQERQWKERFGRRYYHFVYRNVLFLMLCTEDPPGRATGSISPEQQEYAKKALEENTGVRWTLVFLHKPMWTSPDADKTGWSAMEGLLRERRCTVFAGHLHRYQKYVRNGVNFYQLATTGGASRLRGMDYGEFDHVTWITMKKDGPVLANILLDGIYPEDMKKPITAEEGVPIYNRKPTLPTTGIVTLDGSPLPQAYVIFQTPPPPPAVPGATEKPPTPAQPAVRGDAFTLSDGTFTLSTYQANDGIPAGEYVVTIVWRKPFIDESGKPGPNMLNDMYGKTDTTPLKATVKVNSTTFNFDLKR